MGRFSAKRLLSTSKMTLKHNKNSYTRLYGTKNKTGMVQISTSDQLLLMAYGELNSIDARTLQAQIQADSELAREWHSILRVLGRLDTVQASPSETSLKIVLEHSYKTEHLQEI
jgi:hypothetical protein